MLDQRSHRITRVLRDATMRSGANLVRTEKRPKRTLLIRGAPPKGKVFAMARKQKSGNRLQPDFPSTSFFAVRAECRPILRVASGVHRCVKVALAREQFALAVSFIEPVAFIPKLFRQLAFAVEAIDTAHALCSGNANRPQQDAFWTAFDWQMPQASIRQAPRRFSHHLAAFAPRICPRFAN